MWTIFAVLCLASTAEAWTCRCGLFADSQIDNQDGIISGSTFLLRQDIELNDVFDDLCVDNLTTALGACEVACHNWFDGQYGDEFGYCYRAPNRSSRCYGGLFCEVLNNNKHSDVDNDDVRLYHKIPQCNASSPWTSSGRSLALPLCCSGGLWTPCSEGLPPCECYSGEGELCECGVFSTAQINPAPPIQELEPLPVRYLGVDIPPQDNASFCAGFGSPTDPCRMNCTAAGNAEFASYTLNTEHPESAVGATYGAVYCAGLEARGFMLSDDFATTIGAYQRAPFCTQLGWLELADVKHDETLCCDRVGNHRPNCEPAVPGP